MVTIQHISAGLINTHIAETIQAPTQATSCCNLLAPVRQLSSNSRSARISFSQVQRLFIVEHYLASRSYLTCQNEFRDTFPDSPVPNKSKIMSYAFQMSPQKLFTGLHQTWGKEWMHASLNAVDISNTKYNIILSDFNVIYFLTNRTCVRNELRDILIILYNRNVVMIMSNRLDGEWKKGSWPILKYHLSIWLWELRKIIKPSAGIFGLCEDIRTWDLPIMKPTC
jgi:hypothetical protein